MDESRRGRGRRRESMGEKRKRWGAQICSSVIRGKLKPPYPHKTQPWPAGWYRGLIISMCMGKFNNWLGFGSHH
jgi:hypothetical protein